MCKCVCVCGHVNRLGSAIVAGGEKEENRMQDIDRKKRVLLPGSRYYVSRLML